MEIYTNGTWTSLCKYNLLCKSYPKNISSAEKKFDITVFSLVKMYDNMYRPQ